MYKIRLLGKVYSFIFWKVSVAALLSRTTVVAAEVIGRPSKSLLEQLQQYLPRNASDPKNLRYPRLLIKINLVSRCNKHQEKIASLTKFKAA